MFVSERLTLGTLISGALATRVGVIADRLVPPRGPLRRGVGSGKAGIRGRAGSNTLLGPEETDHGQGCCRLVVALVPAPGSGWVSVGASCGTGLLSDQLSATHLVVCWWWVLVAERVWSLFVV